MSFGFLLFAALMMLFYEPKARKTSGGGGTLLGVGLMAWGLVG